eukprot:TRINITY_DN964_c0_g3_i1.p2 TRINITY_DN964_c0_g3~~TRINITY_DN964_c0_g3_i1.p2  ORF type:complete len:71 (+),score=6.80 TRINITY_DN964_c0_g3_i1:1106-1318(+)
MTTKYHNQLKTEHERKDALEEELYALENAIDPGESAKDLAKDLSVKTDPFNTSENEYTKPLQGDGCCILM